LNTSTIRKAIADRNIIEFNYHGYPRIAEPHVYGIHNGKKQLLVYQIGGATSSGKIPDWRRINLDEISGIKVLTEQKFPGPRLNPSQYNNQWDTIVSMVQ
jgi:hypothetical protein